MIKYMLTTAAFLATAFLANAQKLEKLWTTDSVFKVPESVLFDEPTKDLYVSNIDGASGAKDGKGGISKMNTDGKITNLNWVTGLHAPKGMAMHDDVLYVADVDAVVGFSNKDGKQMFKVEIEGAKFLNDLTVDANGTLYVSDSETGKIHEIKNKKASVYVDELTRPNGVLWHNGRLFYLDAGSLYCKDIEGSIKTIVSGMDRSTDGIEAVDNIQYFLVSSWVGIIYLVDMHTSTATELINTKDQKINSADIGYDPVNKIVYVPTFADNRVVAYKLIMQNAK